MFKKHHAYATSIIKNRDMYQNMMADYVLMWTQVLPFTNDSVPRSFSAESHFDLHNGPMRPGLSRPIEEEGESVRVTDSPSCSGASLCWCWGLILPTPVTYAHALSSIQSTSQEKLQNQTTHGASPCQSIPEANFLLFVLMLELLDADCNR